MQYTGVCRIQGCRNFNVLLVIVSNQNPVYQRFKGGDVDDKLVLVCVFIESIPGFVEELRQKAGSGLWPRFVLSIFLLSWMVHL